MRADNQCDFGKWLYGAARNSFGSTADYEHVRGLHADFHREAARVLELAVSGQAKDAAAAMVVSAPFGKVSSQLTTTLTQLAEFLRIEAAHRRRRR